MDSDGEKKVCPIHWTTLILSVNDFLAKLIKIPSYMYFKEVILKHEACYQGFQCYMAVIFLYVIVYYFQLRKF